MSSIRKTKKEVAYLTGEVISNCYLAAYFQGETAQEPLLKIIDNAVQLHNTTMDAINQRPEKNNRSLTRKHFHTLETNLINGVDAMFAEISAICQK